MLSQPELLLAELRKQTEVENEALTSGDLDKDIREISRRLKGYAGQERRLMNALRMEVATPDVILDELNQMKRERAADENRLASLNDMKEHILKTIDLETKLKELSSLVVGDLDNCTAADKKEAFTYLDLKVKASPESVDIKGYVDLKLITTGQTSGCLIQRTYEWPTGNETIDLFDK